MKHGPLYAVLWDYDFMVEALDMRRGEMGLSCDALDDRAGFAKGVTGKVLGPSQSAKLGWKSAFEMARNVGLDIAFIVNDKATADILAGREPRHENHVRSGNYAARRSIRITRRVQAQFAAATNAKLRQTKSREWFKQRAKRAADSRWSKQSAPAETGER